MDYIELSITVPSAEVAEILTAELADMPFESFTTERDVLKAYIPQHALADCKDEADALLERYGVSGRYVQIESQNWNALWESNFTPVDVDGRVLIRAPFHAAQPGHETEIVIMPKMSFGTGHHATTCLMVRMILGADLHGRRGLDLGCGTGVLAIAAVRYGAAEVDAVDIDDFAYENCCENVQTNGVADRIHPIMGDISAVAGRKYDFILANINRNILLHDMEACVGVLQRGGEIFMSGFLVQDIDTMREAAAEHGLALTREAQDNGWVALGFRYEG